MNFVQLPNNIVYAWIPRTASTSVARALLDAFYPERLLIPVSLPADRLEPIWQHLLPRAHTMEGQRIVGLIRDPIERFRSACARTGSTVENGLTTNDVHFSKVSELTRHTVVEWYQFPLQLAEFCAVVGLPSVPTLNDSNPGTKPDLTPEQLTAVISHYAEDIALFEAAGVPIALHVPPAPVAEARTITKLTLKSRFDALGKWGDFKAACIAIDAWDDFLMAQDVRTDNPLFTTAAPLLKASLNLTDAEFATLLT